MLSSSSLITDSKLEVNRSVEKLWVICHCFQSGASKDEKQCPHKKVTDYYCLTEVSKGLLIYWSCMHVFIVYRSFAHSVILLLHEVLERFSYAILSVVFEKEN